MSEKYRCGAADHEFVNAWGARETRFDATGPNQKKPLQALEMLWQFSGPIRLFENVLSLFDKIKIT